MTEKNKVCGNCKYHYMGSHPYGENDWACVNDKSDYCTDYTNFDWSCDEFEVSE